MLKKDVQYVVLFISILSVTGDKNVDGYCINMVENIYLILWYWELYVFYSQPVLYLYLEYPGARSHL